MPIDWAATTGNRGVAMFLLGEWTEDIEAAEQAVGLFKAASATMTEAGHAAAAAQYTNNILAVEALVAQMWCQDIACRADFLARANSSLPVEPLLL